MTNSREKRCSHCCEMGHRLIGWLQHHDAFQFRVIKGCACSGPVQSVCIRRICCKCSCFAIAVLLDRSPGQVAHVGEAMAPHVSCHDAHGSLCRRQVCNPLLVDVPGQLAIDWDSQLHVS